jgi:ligand-binding sensor domain-containing protein
MSDGLIFSDGQTIQKYLLSPGDMMPGEPIVYDLVSDGSGRLWALTSWGLFLHDEASDAWQLIESTDHPCCISADHRGGLWAISRDPAGPVSYFDGETWTHHPFLDHYPCNPTSILADVGGGLWLSSRDCALRGFNGEVWDEYDSGSRGDRLFRGSDGDVYAVGPREHSDIRRYDGDTWEALPPVDPSRRAWVIDLAVSPDDEVWAAFDAPPGLFVYRDGEWKETLGSDDERVTTLLFDSQGDLWARHKKGLLHYDGETWQHIKSAFPLGDVSAIAKDRQGRIWVGGGNGLIVYDPARDR